MKILNLKIVASNVLNDGPSLVEVECEVETGVLFWKRTGKKRAFFFGDLGYWRDSMTGEALGPWLQFALDAMYNRECLKARTVPHG